MAKRANPYAEDFSPQSKTYIGMKQFNNNEVRLKKVYEKTLNLLFHGAKKSKSPHVVTPAGICHGKELRGQLVIGKNGTLVHSEEKISERQVPEQLCLCNTPTNEHCAYCEKPLCDSCNQTCDCCKQSYCGNCFVIGSERSSCVSCYR